MLLNPSSPQTPEEQKGARVAPLTDRARGAADPGESPAEAELSRYFERYVDDGQRKVRFPVRHPIRTLRAAKILRSLPVLALAPGAGADGTLIRRLLARPLLVRLAFQGVVSVLVLPEDVREYLAGGPKRRLREYVHIADRLGLRYEAVESSAERIALLALADARERADGRLLSRDDDPHNQDTLPLHTWLVVRSRDGRPLMLTVAAVDGEWAVLRYSRTLVRDKESAVARYAAMPFLVERLRRNGVRFVADPGRPYWLANGVRRYQRKVGFRLVRVRLLP